MSLTLLILKIHTTFKYVQMMLKWFFFYFFTGFRFSKISVECSVHICSCPWTNIRHLEKKSWSFSLLTYWKTIILGKVSWTRPWTRAYHVKKNKKRNWLRILLWIFKFRSPETKANRRTVEWPMSWRITKKLLTQCRYM